MRDMNKVFLLGRISSLPGRKETKKGVGRTVFSIGTTKDGRTTSHSIVVWGEASSAALSLQIGDVVLVEGTMVKGLGGTIEVHAHTLNPLKETV